MSKNDKGLMEWTAELETNLSGMRSEMEYDLDLIDREENQKSVDSMSDDKLLSKYGGISSKPLAREIDLARLNIKSLMRLKRLVHGVTIPEDRKRKEK